jgi:short-subunit dehydrogenase
VTSSASPRTILVIGGASDIGRAIARDLATAGSSIILAARDSARLEPDAQDIRLRTDATATLIDCDVLDIDGHAAFLDALPALPDVAVCVVGLLGDQKVSQADAEAALRVMNTNYVAPALLLGALANRMEARGSGTIVGVSSVAGDRGRASNYVYGSAKAGFTAFLSGLRARLSRTPVRVITVKPGFVRTQMTAGMKLNPLLTAEPDEVARAVRKAVERGRDVIYVRSLWRLIMGIVAHLPEGLFKKTRF